MQTHLHVGWRKLVKVPPVPRIVVELVAAAIVLAVKCAVEPLQVVCFELI